MLDPDELSLVNRTFKKPPEGPKPSSNKKPPLTSKLMNPSTISKHFSPVRLQKPSMQVENRHHAAAPGNSVKSTGNASKRADLHNYGAKGVPLILFPFFLLGCFAALAYLLDCLFTTLNTHISSFQILLPANKVLVFFPGSKLISTSM